MPQPNRGSTSTSGSRILTDGEIQGFAQLDEQHLFEDRHFLALDMTQARRVLSQYPRFDILMFPLARFFRDANGPGE